jgi:TRAP-type C4-dicarboxylate transport system permease small subunit
MYTLLFSMSLQITGRYIPFIPRYLWPLEVTNFSLIWLVFLGSIIGVRGRRHFFVDIFGEDISLKLRKIIDVIYFFVLYSMAIIFIFFGYKYFVEWGLIQNSDITGVNMGFLYFSVPFSGISWLIFLTEDLYKSYFQKPSKT